MKKIAIAYKGVFNFRKVSQGIVDESLLYDIKNNIDNHHTKMFKFFDDDKIDYYFSTYDLSDKINTIYKEKLKPVYYGYTPTSLSLADVWVSHLKHYRNLIHQIRNRMDMTRDLYDAIIFTRPDLKLVQNFSELDIDFSKFNIVVKHPSGNCDDNLFILPLKYLDIFSESVNELYENNRITHEINHVLEKRGAQINYLSGYAPNLQPDGIDYGQPVWTFAY